MESLIIIIFIIGYWAIAFEHTIKINKAGTAILTGVLCWSVIALFPQSFNQTTDVDSLSHHLSDISSILFFLLGAMTIVELIDAHDGFDLITNRIQTTNKRTLLWIVAFLAFFLSAVLDNLTTTIVMVTMLSKLLKDKNDKWMFVSIVVIAANAGGAWSPIGDVTTTMLWIGGQITPLNIILRLIIPSLVCLLVPLLLVSFRINGKFEKVIIDQTDNKTTIPAKHRNIIFWSGISVLLFVPCFKTITHLPPYMGMLFGLGVLWILSELIHKDKDEEDKNSLSVVYALRKVDVPSVLLFLGILLAIGAIQATGQLTQLATYLETHIKNMNLIVITIGFLSAIVDNVPLVAAVQSMYDLNVYPADHYFWEFLAYCSGTGGSVLIIGSAAGVAAMGMEKIEFFWYLKKVSFLAIVGYLAGALVYIYIL